MAEEQTKLVSLTETIFSLTIGYLLAVIVQIILLPLFGAEITIAANFKLAAIFTFISLVRTYFVRRFFNWLHVKGYL